MFRFILPIYNDAGISAAESLRPLLRPWDVFLISSGNVASGPVKTDWVSTTSAKLDPLPPTSAWLLTSGLENMKSAATDLEGVVDTILCGFEPNAPGFTWDPFQSADFITCAAHIATEQGFQSGAYLTGRPLLQKHEVDGAWVPYDWNYERMTFRCNEIIVQTQTYASDPVKFKEACAVADQEVGQSNWSPQITVGDPAKNPNAVDEAQALDVLSAVWARLHPGVVLWAAPSDFTIVQSILTTYRQPV